MTDSTSTHLSQMKSLPRYNVDKDNFAKDPTKIIIIDDGRRRTSASLAMSNNNHGAAMTIQRLVVALSVLVLIQASIVLHGFSYGVAANGGRTYSIDDLQSCTMIGRMPASFRSNHHRHHDNRPASSSKVGLCAFVRDVSSYIDEWADYNLIALEFSELFLYDNDDNFVLGPWAEKRRQAGQNVTAIHEPASGVDTAAARIDAYNKCLKTHRDKVDYMAFLGAEEFLVLYQHDRVADFLDEYLVPGSSLSVNWRVFGSSNKTAYAPLPVTYRYQYREASVDPRVRSFVRPKDFVKMANAHSVLVKKAPVVASDVIEDPGWRDTSRKKQKMERHGRENHAKPHDVAVVHHYKFKSREEWNRKACVAPAQEDGKRNRCGIELPPGDIHDNTAWRFLKSKVPKYGMYDMFSDYA